MSEELDPRRLVQPGDPIAIDTRKDWRDRPLPKPSNGHWLQGTVIRRTNSGPEWALFVRIGQTRRLVLLHEVGPPF